MRLLIVDDEPYTREGLKEEIDWKKLGIDEILDADDGETARNMLEWFQPDLVITDIRMPNMDGISFAENFKEKCPESQLIFMSGYMEIEYLKKALKLSAVDFIEKPLDMDEVVEAARKALNAIQEKRQEKIDREKDQVQTREAKEERLVNYLKIRKTDRSLILDMCRQIGFPPEGIYFCVCIKDEEKSDKFGRMLLDIHDFFSEKKIHSIAAAQPGYSYLIILAGKNEKIISNRKMLEELKRQLGGVQIGVGFPVQHLGAICESGKLAYEAINRSFFRNTEQAIWEITEISERSKILDASMYNQMKKALTQHPAQLSAVINSTIESIRKQANVEPDSVKKLAEQFVNDMIQEYPYLKQCMDNFLQGITLREYLEDSMALSDIQKLLIELTDNIGGQTLKIGISPVIRKVYRYIAANIGKPELSLLDISEHVGLSVTHISTLFRKETNITIRQYIEKYRIEQAKIFLQQQKKITEVAQLCGYSQANYFVRVFKQETGITPGEFRKNFSTEE